MEKNTEHKSQKPETSHSNFRKGLPDYNDGGNLTHHLGNDDYPDRTNSPDLNFESDNPKLGGKEAAGNNMLEDEELDNDEKE